MIQLEKNQIDLDGVIFDYYKMGKGKPLFIIPALHSDFSRFQLLLEYLSRYYTIYFPELPGVGMSTHLFDTQKYSAQNYAHYLNLMVSKLKLSDYTLIGFCLGAVIAIRMLEKNNIPRPIAVILFEALYDGNYIHIDKKYSWIISLIMKLGPQNLLVRKFAGLALQNTKLLTLFYRFNYRHEKDLKKVIDHQIKLTKQMDTRAWLELTEDIFTLHLGRENLTFDLPTLLVFNIADNILDIEKTIAGVTKIFPRSQVVNIELTHHAPAGPIDEKLVHELMTPILPKMHALLSVE